MNSAREPSRRDDPNVQNRAPACCSHPSPPYPAWLRSDALRGTSPLPPPDSRPGPASFAQWAKPEGASSPRGLSGPESWEGGPSAAQARAGSEGAGPLWESDDPEPNSGQGCRRHFERQLYVGAEARRRRRRARSPARRPQRPADCLGAMAGLKREGPGLLETRAMSGSVGRSWARVGDGWRCWVRSGEVG